MNFEQAQQDVLNWIINFVEQPHAALNGWAPCPYARRARVNQQLDIRPGSIDPVTDCQSVDLQQFDVIAFVYDPAQHAPAVFEQQVQQLNINYLLPRGMFALADHPGNTESVNGVVMNQGTWALCFVQNLAKLDNHAQLLAQQGYYHNWPEQYLADLFAGRRDPRDKSA